MDVTERKRASYLLEALNQSAQEMEKHLVHDDIFGAISESLSNLGFTCLLFPFDGEKQRLYSRYMSFDVKSLKTAGKLIGINDQNYSLPLTETGFYEEVVKSQKTIFLNDASDLVSHWLPKRKRKHAKRVIELLKAPKVILAPLVVDENVTGVFSVHGKDLKEETSLAFELGTRYGTKNASCEASLFYTDLDDLIVGGYVGTATDTDAENAGNVNSCGAELKGEVDLGGLYDWGFKCPLWAAVTYTHARLDGDATSKDPGSIFSGGEDGNSVPYIPDFQASIGYGVQFSKLECDITASYVDSAYTTANNSSEHVNPVTGKADARFGKTDSRVVVDVSARYALGGGWATFINLHNLFDEEYIASRHPYGPRPGQPFTAMAGVEATF